VRNILIRKNYLAPGAAAAGTDPRETLTEAMRRGVLSAEDLLEHYTALVHAQTGSYQETGRRLGVDHRTVKSRLRAELVEKYRQ
jgi:hypothetical protein